MNLGEPLHGGGMGVCHKGRAAGAIQQTLRRLSGVIRPRPLGACDKGVGTFPAEGYVALSGALRYPRTAECAGT
jgi:hypothetical protein